MNRRTTIKSILGLGFVAVSGFSIFKWTKINRTADLSLLLNNKNLIAELAETVIPRTETPGAKDAKVEEFIIDFIRDCANNKNQNLFIEGLKDVQELAGTMYGKNYEYCIESEKWQLLTHFESEAENGNDLIRKIRNKFLGQPFFSQLKELTVIGYCTSEAGATKGLAYDYIPADFISCTKLLPGQRSWATK